MGVQYIENVFSVQFSSVAHSRPTLHNPMHRSMPGLPIHHQLPDFTQAQSLVPLPFLNPAWTCGSSWFVYCWSLAWRIFSITLLVCVMSTIVQQFEHFLALPFFGIGRKTDLFQSCGHCWVFQICWRIECSTFTASSFRIWNSSTGIPSPPLTLCVVINVFYP